MTLEEGFFPSWDGERLFYCLRPSSQSKGLLLLLHGHGEHSGRYLKFFDRLQDRGLAIAIFDLRGCGHSGGLPVYVSEFEDYLKDVSSFLDFLRLKRGLTADPLTLFGHSLGGLIATVWAQKNASRVSKLILSSPLFGVPQASLLRGLVSFLNFWVPRHMIKNPVRPPYLTHDQEEVRRYETDTLICRTITVRLVHEMLKYTAFLQRNPPDFPFPVYLLMAEEKERVVDPRATRRVYKGLKAPEKILETFPGFYHEIFNEKGQGQVFERLRYYLGRPKLSPP